MQCPRCGGSDISPVGQTHYVCNNKQCMGDAGERTQFSIVYDEKIHFPYNQIFVSRPKREFYKMEYLKIKTPGRASA